MIDQAEEEQAMRGDEFTSRLRTGVRVGAALLALVLLGIAPAHAGVGGSATPTWPGSATVGDIFSASVLIINTSTDPNQNENVGLTSLFVTPACKSGLTPICLGGDVDP